MRGRLSGVLFDMDGTVLDSEKIWDVALEDLAQWLGGEISQAARHRMVGASLARAVAILHEDLRIDADPESSSAFLLLRAEELFRTRLEWKPGARELLEAVRDAGIPAALVTSTHRRMVEIALDTIGRDFFVAIVCGDEVAHTKPHADPYVRAASLLGTVPQACVAIEDSPAGVASAESAGCAVLAIPSVPIPAAPSRTVRASLVGVTVSELAALVSAHRAADTTGPASTAATDVRSGNGGGVPPNAGHRDR
jgi:HAD superfamily hydrolase (TIGR01509 family)